MEILFVDDCSPDNSSDIIRSCLSDYPNRKNQVTILRTPKNGGLAAARLYGILRAKGDYLIHCDGDDWVDLNLYEKMYQAAIDQGADIVTCDFIEEYPDYQLYRKYGIDTDNPQKFLSNWYKHTKHMSCCNKLVSRRLYVDNSVYPWPGLNMWEDNGLTTRLFYYANKVVSVDGDVYHYNRMNSGAITSGYGIKQVEQMLEIASKLSEFFDSKADGYNYTKTINAFKYLARINLITDSYKNYIRFRKVFPECKSIAKSLDRNAFSAKGLFRFNMVRFGLASIFILMFKTKKLLQTI